MITKAEYERTKLTGHENFMLTQAEQTALENMARELGVPKSAIIRDGLKMVYNEFRKLQGAANENSAAA